MSATKTVQQRYQSDETSQALLEQFRLMVNDCIRIGLSEDVSSLKALSLRCYKQLSRYDALSYYKLCAISRASGILKNYKKAKRRIKRARVPYVWKPQLTTCYGFKIKDGCLLLPSKFHERIRIPMNRHTLEVLSDPSLTVRSVTLTANTLGLTISRDPIMMRPIGLVGLDSNLSNITLADSKGSIEKHDLERATVLKSRYRKVKSRFKRNDVRVRKRIYRKYGQKQRLKIQHLLHNISKHVVEDAKAKQYGIVMEDLTHIRKLYRKGNWQAREYRARMNGWSFRELQRQIEYKALWEGIPVYHVNARGTSSTCATCGCSSRPNAQRTLQCPNGHVSDRDVNAAKNILKRGMRFVPFAHPVEAMVQERNNAVPTLDSRWM